MKNKIFNLFLVLMLIAGVFVVNTNTVCAGGTSGLKISSGDDFREFNYNKDKKILELNSQTTDDIEGLDITVDDINEERYAVVKLTKDTHLYCDVSGGVIESAIPLKISSYNNDGEDNRYTLYIHCPEERTPGINHNDIGIECNGSLLIDNVNIVFYPELESKEYLVDEEDEYKAIYVDDSQYEEYNTSNVTVSNSDIVVYGTKGIINNNGNVLFTNNSNFRMFMKTPSPEHMNYTDFEGTCIENGEGGLEIDGYSYFYVRAEIPEQSLYSNPIEVELYMLEPLVLAPSFIHVEKQSSFIVEEPNYHYLNAVSTTTFDAEGIVTIEGGIYGIMQLVPRFKNDLQASSKIYGFHFDNAIIEITSLLVGICARQQPSSGTMSVSIARNSVSKHTDFIRVVGDEDDARELELNENNICAIYLYDNDIFYSDISSEYKFVAPYDSSETEPSEFSEIVDTSNIKQYKELAIVLVGPQPIKLGFLNINSDGHRSTYYPDNTSDGDKEYFNNAFNVSYSEATGFTIDVKKDFDFKMKTDEPARMYISCPYYGLHINGNNHTLSFTTNTEGSRMTAPVVCIMLSSVEESSVKDLNIKLETKDSTTTANTTLLFADEGLTPRSTTVGEKIVNNNFSLSNVNIYANSFSPLFRLSNLKTSITDSSIIYNYQTPLYVSEEYVQVDSIISTFKDVTIEDSKLEVHGNVAYDASSKAKVAISEISGNCNIKNCVVKGDGIDLGIGAFGIDIEDSNIDISSNRGGLIGFQSIHIKLSDGYHCNVTSKAATLDQEKVLYPAIYSTITPVFDLPKDCVFKAVYPDGKEEIFNVNNMSKYASVSIVTNGSQEEEEEHHHHSGGYIIPSTGIK